LRDAALIVEGRLRSGRAMQPRRLRWNSFCWAAVLAECRTLFFGLSLILREGHPFANDFSARLVVFHSGSPWAVILRQAARVRTRLGGPRQTTAPTPAVLPVPVPAVPVPVEPPSETVISCKNCGSPIGSWVEVKHAMKAEARKIA